MDTGLIFAEDVRIRDVIVESNSCLATRATLGPALPAITISRVISSILPFHIIAEKVVSKVVQEISKVGKETQHLLNINKILSYSVI